MIGVGFIGFGHVARTRYVDLLSSIRQAELIAICDSRSAARAAALAEVGARASVYSELERFLDHEGLDVVAVLSPGVTHAELVEMALRQKHHTYSEKPLAYDARFCERLFALARQQGVSLVAAPAVGTSPGLSHLRSLLVGTEQMAHVSCVEPGPAESPWFAGQVAPYYTWESRGCLFDLGIYGGDVLVELFGHGASVRAVASRTGRSEDTRVPDSWSALLEWPDGQHAALQVSWRGRGDRQPEVVVYEVGRTLRAPIWGFGDTQNVIEHREIAAAAVPLATPDFSAPTVGWGLLWLLHELLDGKVVENRDTTVEVLRILNEIWDAGTAAGASADRSS